MKIKYSKKETKNLGNYENIVVEISIEDNVDIDIETRDECFLRLKDFVNNKFKEEFQDKILSVGKYDNINIEDIDIEDVKFRISKLIDSDKKYREVLKNILKSYNVNKIQDLTKIQLKEFNQKLLLL